MMTTRMALIVLLLLLPGCLLFVAGCTTPRIGDSYNTTVLIEDYNTWAAQQKIYSEQVRVALVRMGDHVDTYNQEIAKSSPDIATLQENIAADRQILDQWSTSQAGLDAATDIFDTGTANLSYGNDLSMGRQRDLVLQEMKIYSIDMANARQHLVDYNNNLGKYISSDDPDYWNDALLTAAMSAKAEALVSVSDGDFALSNITRLMQTIQDRQ